MAKLVMVDDVPESKSYRLVPVDDAPAPKPFGQRLNDEIAGIPRQLGLTARYAAEGAASIPAMLANVPAYAYNKVADLVQGDGNGRRMHEQSGNVSSLLDAIGLPKPQNTTERVVGDVSRSMASTGGLLKAAGGLPFKSAAELTTNPLQQAVGAAAAGGAGGYTRETGGNAGAQFAASLVGGLAGAGATSLAQKGVSAVKNVAAPKPAIPDADIELKLNGYLQSNGIDLGSVAPAVRAQMAAEVRKAMQTGGNVNPDVIRRLADYSAVGATPTRGSVTLDPSIITQERNLAKIGANSKDPSLQQLAMLQNQNNKTLLEILNGLGASGPYAGNTMAAGEKLIGAVGNRYNAARATQKQLYADARDSSGRAIPLDRSAFVNQAYDNLAASNKGNFLPGEIESMLNQISGGVVTRGGKQYPVPFDVNTIDSLQTTLATAARGAKDGNVRAAIADVRNALEKTPISSSNATATGSTIPTTPGMGQALNTAANELPQQSMAAFNQARRYTRAMKGWEESSAGIKAAIDDANPEKFVQNYVIGNGEKAAYSDVKSLFNTLKRDPEAIDAAKQSVLGFLKSRAGNGASDEVANFSQSAYNKALSDIGDFKLGLMFNRDEIAKLKAVGRVASYDQVQPRGSAVNNSNTAAGIAGLVERIADNPLIGKIPFGRQMVAEPLGNISASMRIKQAMSPSDAIISPVLREKQRQLPIWMLPGLLGTQQN